MEFYHIGLIVSDIARAIEHCQSLGCTLGIPRLPSEFFLDSSTYLDYEVCGKRPDTLHKTKMMFVNIHGLLIELVQPIEGETMYKEFLNTKGEGIHHMAFYVDDLEEETAKLIEKGIPAITKIKLATGVALTYFDTTKIGNLITELVQLPK